MNELDKLFSQTENEMKKIFPISTRKYTGQSKLIGVTRDTRATCKSPGNVPVNNNAMIEYCNRPGSSYMMFTNNGGLHDPPIYLKHIEIQISLSANNIIFTSPGNGPESIGIHISFSQAKQIFPMGRIPLNSNQDVYKISFDLQNTMLITNGWFELWMESSYPYTQKINNATIAIEASYNSYL